MSANTRNLAQVILFHRKQSGMSRATCARLAGVGKTVLYDIEHGKTTVQLDNFLKLLHVLNITVQFSSPLMHLFRPENDVVTQSILPAPNNPTPNRPAPNSQQ